MNVKEDDVTPWLSPLHAYVPGPIRYRIIIMFQPRYTVTDDTPLNETERTSRAYYAPVNRTALSGNCCGMHISFYPAALSAMTLKMNFVTMLDMRNIFIEDFCLGTMESLSYIIMPVSLHVGDGFLAESPNLRVVDMRYSTMLTSLRSNFLANCRDLREVYMAPTIQHVGNSFLAGSGVIHMYPTTLLSIGQSFMAGCDMLVELDMSFTMYLREIPARFLEGCVRLKSLEFTSNDNLVAIGDLFLAECTGLTNLDMRSFYNVRSIGNAFARCPRLQILDMSPFHSLEKVGSYFPCGIGKVPTKSLPGHVSLSTIGRNFTWPNFHNLRGARHLPENFMYGSAITDTRSLEALSDVIVVDDGFFCHSVFIRTINLCPMINLARIGDMALSMCSSLTEIVISNLPHLHRIGNSFGSRCSSLQTFMMTNLPSLERLGDGFLVSCDNLTTVNISGVENLQRIDTLFLARCAKLTEIDLSFIPMGCRISTGILSGSPLKIVDLSTSRHPDALNHIFSRTNPTITEVICVPGQPIPACVQRYMNAHPGTCVLK